MCRKCNNNNCYGNCDIAYNKQIKIVNKNIRGSYPEWEDIQNKPSEFPPGPHKHFIEDIDGLEEALSEITNGIPFWEQPTPGNGYSIDNKVLYEVGGTTYIFVSTIDDNEVEPTVPENPEWLLVGVEDSDIVRYSRRIDTDATLKGGGDLSADRTLGIADDILLDISNKQPEITGGTTNQFLKKNSNSDGDFKWEGIVGSDLGIYTTAGGSYIPAWVPTSNAWGGFVTNTGAVPVTIGMRTSTAQLRAADAIGNSDLVPLGQLNTLLVNKVDKSGDTMTGELQTPNVLISGNDESGYIRKFSNKIERVQYMPAQDFYYVLYITGEVEDEDEYYPYHIMLQTYNEIFGHESGGGFIGISGVTYRLPSYEMAPWSIYSTYPYGIEALYGTSPDGRQCIVMRSDKWDEHGVGISVVSSIGYGNSVNVDTDIITSLAGFSLYSIDFDICENPSKKWVEETFVNKGGDTMTGALSVPAVKLQPNTGVPIADELTADGDKVEYSNSSGVKKALAFDETGIKTISANTSLDDTYHNCIVRITANCTITVSSSLRSDFNCVFDAIGSVTGTFVAGSGVTLSAPWGLILRNNSMCSLYKTGSTAYRLNGGLTNA